MPRWFSYRQTIFGTQTTVNGAAFDFVAGPSVGQTFRWTGSQFTHTVREQSDTATNYNGDPTNEEVSPNERIGATGQQSTEVAGTARPTIIDYVFGVTDGTQSYQIGVIDVDLNGNNTIGTGENGYYLIFIGDPPPADTDLTIQGISSNNNAYPHDDLGALVVCFARDTQIMTDRGQVAVQALGGGDLIMTRDAGLRPVRWIGSQRLSAATLNAFPNLRPIRIRAGALGEGCPSQDLLVSPQHRVLVRSRLAQDLFGADEVLVAAKQLLSIAGIETAEDLPEVEYFHFLLDDHQVVFANGAEAESLYTGRQALKAVGRAALDEIYAIFPELRDRDPDDRPEAARRLLTGRQGRILAARHAAANRPLLDA